MIGEAYSLIRGKTPAYWHLQIDSPNAAHLRPIMRSMQVVRGVLLLLLMALFLASGDLGKYYSVLTYAMYYVMFDHYSSVEASVAEAVAELFVALWLPPESLLFWVVWQVAVYCHSKHFLKKVDKLVSPSRIYFRQAGMLDRSKYNTNGRMVDPTVADESMCLWNLAFEEPRVAQSLLSGRRDGRAGPEVINQLVIDGSIQVFTRDGAHPHNVGYSKATEIYIDMGHAVDKIPPEYRALLSPKLYDGEPVGILLAERTKTKQVREDCREHNDMASQQYTLEQVLPLGGDAGKMAEYGLLALAGDQDNLDALLAIQPIDTCTTQEISRWFLSNPGWHVYDVKQRAWVKNRKPRRAHKGKGQIAENVGIAWNGTQTVDIKWVTGRPVADGPQSRYLVFIEKMTYRRGYNVAKVVIPLLFVAVAWTLSFYEGPPACGKTTKVVQAVFESPADFVTAPSKSCVEAYVDRGVPAMTIDAILMTVAAGRGDQFSAKNVWLDEGILEHPGVCPILARIFGADEIRLTGDRKQIAYINRSHAYECRYDEWQWDVGKHIYDPRSWDNNELTADLWRPDYPLGYVSMSGVRGEIEKYRISGPAAVPAGFDMYLTYTQGEKTLMKLNHPGRKVKTIHEAQGGRWNSVCLVRTRANKDDIYSKREYMIVASTRARRRFHYATVLSGDPFWKRLGGDASATVVDEAVDKADIAEVYSLTGGAYHEVTRRVVRLSDPEENESYQFWQGLVSTFHPSPEVGSLAFTTLCSTGVYRFADSAVAHPAITSVQAVLDGLYFRRYEDIAKQERMIWPIKWPDGVRVDLVKTSATPALEKAPAIHPYLATAQQPRALRHPWDINTSLAKRVLGEVRLKIYFRPSKIEARYLQFMKFCVDPNKLVASRLAIPVECKEMRNQSWNKKGDLKRDQVCKCDPIRVSGMVYYMETKSVHKLRVDGGHEDGVTAGQLISAHHVFWTSVFSPFFVTMMVILQSSLKDDIIINANKPWDEVSAMIDGAISGKTFKSVEGDMSKYDKSQEEVMAGVQELIMWQLGAPDYAVKQWSAFHELTVLKAPKYGIAVTIAHQRRTGDAATYFGNCVVLMVLLADIFALCEYWLLVLGGDDNWFAMKDSTTVEDRSAYAAEELNFEMKVLTSVRTIYFSSRFLLLTTRGWLLVGDPLKIVGRWGRDDLKGDEHLRAIHKSMRELHYHYRSAEVRHLVAEAATQRQMEMRGTEAVNIILICEAIAAALDDYAYFKSYFYGTTAEWNLKLDPNERVGGGYYDKAPAYEFTVDI